MLAVTEEIGFTILSAKTSHEAWHSLETAFLSQTAAQEDLLEQQWRDLQKGSKPMLEFINDVKKKALSFAQIGKPKTSTEVNREIYTGLGPEWELLILAKSDTMVTICIDELTSLLMGHEERRLYAATREQSQQLTPAPLSGILGPLSAEVHYIDNHGRIDYRGINYGGKAKNRGKGKGIGQGSAYGGHGLGGNYRGGQGSFGRNGSGYNINPARDTRTIQPGFSSQPGSFNSMGSTQIGPFHMPGSPASASNPVATSVANIAEASSQGLHDLDWYMDSGATHHVTSHLADLNIHDEALHSDHIYVGNDSSLFILQHSTYSIFLLVSVDDIILTGTPGAPFQSILATLHKEFALKDLGPLHFFLGMEAKSDSAGLYLTQSKYIHDIIVRTSMLDCKPISSPVAAGSRLSLHDGHPFEDPSLYRSVVGCLQYLSLTRPDIAYAVNQVYQFMHKPSVTHWLAVKRILRYLKGTITYGLHLRLGSISALHGYSDAD
ncbi:hypothetical protein CRG98_013194 [Punica granatum]|uniref:Reverse transcriptase Ty1/copia-type domain-containing protein n=1 Tax=Punica granatum TaxID=22663 RepID=A0A2I0KCY3_PUNGR|nr:hypothetical protein CRG98_013194 [Punica granatum]